MNKKPFLILPLTLSLFILSQTQTFAKEVGLTASPSKIFLRQSLPISRSETITITNSSAKEELLSFEKKVFTADEFGKIKFTDPDKASSKILSENFLILDNSQQVSTITLPPNDSKDINIQLNLSKDLKSEDLLFGILLRTEVTPLDQVSDKGISATSQISTGIFIPIIISPSDTSPQVLIDTFSTDLFTTSSTPTFKLTLKNTSEHATSSNVDLSINNIFGKEIKNIKFTNKIITSKSKYHIAFTDSSTQKLLVGVYKAKLEVRSLGTRLHDQKEIYIFILQLKKTVILSGILVALLLIALRVRMKRKSL